MKMGHLQSVFTWPLHILDLLSEISYRIKPTSKIEMEEEEAPNTVGRTQTIL